jgi:hypothetical protein
LGKSVKVIFPFKIFFSEFRCIERERNAEGSELERKHEQGKGGDARVKEDFDDDD